MKVKILDVIMGGGKTTAMINYINSYVGDEKFIFVTPYLTEVERIIDACPNKEFYQPLPKPSKLYNLKNLLKGNNNIAMCHALLYYLDQEVINMIKDKNYILIMDEVVDVVVPYEKKKAIEKKEGITRSDINCILKNYGHLDPKTHLIVWEKDSYDGGLNKYKQMCKLGCIALYGSNQDPLWLFPADVFTAFKDVYIMTYMFDAQIQKYYYDLKGIKYEYLFVDINSDGDYFISKDPPKSKLKDYYSLINICEREKLNYNKNKKYDFSKSWYKINQNNNIIVQLKNNVGNYFRNICKASSNECLWTTFKDYKDKIKGKGYAKGYVSCNLRATNEFRDRKYFAYLINRYMNPVVKNFFIQNNIHVDEDKYALSGLLQCMWRTRIRDDKPINVFIPSSRMRELLECWIDENSPKIAKQEKNHTIDTPTLSIV